jgi:protein-tyrosine-phosphatase
MSRDPNTPTSFNLLFVCTGNTCRSPMAAALARHDLAERGWTHVSVASAGASALAGSPASPEVPAVLAEIDIEFGDHQASELTPDRIEWADSVLVMSPSHLAAVEALGGAGKASLITEFLDGGEAGSPVVDPIGGGIDVYRTTRDQLRRAVRSVLDRLQPILAP